MATFFHGISLWLLIIKSFILRKYSRVVAIGTEPIPKRRSWHYWAVYSISTLIDLLSSVYNETSTLSFLDNNKIDCLWKSSQEKIKLYAVGNGLSEAKLVAFSQLSELGESCYNICPPYVMKIINIDKVSQPYNPNDQLLDD